MDVRVSSYNNITSLRFGAGAGGPTTYAATSSQNAGPVQAAAAISSNGNTGTHQAKAPQNISEPNETQRYQANAEGRGQLIDIYA
ncbi:MAG: hypothetical protein COY40_05495 [Alphaproteobacteria bacterium CG_4_10_14_0_8_um_filter_53_9]|nr:MAG: hypothetical protein COY40_05495 [Alphaproteobacteria bacterium CG_4_10_14_0_8_um_filter_53_9]